MNQGNVQLNKSDVNESAKRRRRIRFWDFLLWVIIIVLAAAVFVRAFVVSKVTVSGESMTSSYYDTEDTDHYNTALTYHDGDTVTINKLKSPNRGDVVVFYKFPVKSRFLALFARGASVEENGEYYKLIKRVVALGGDKLWLESDGLEEGQYRLVVQTADGEILRENYYKKNGSTLSADCFIISDDAKSGPGRLANYTEQNPLVIEDGFFFAMGDNRDNSADSRGELGAVPLSQLFGVVVDSANRFIVKGSYFPSVG